MKNIFSKNINEKKSSNEENFIQKYSTYLVQ